MVRVGVWRNQSEKIFSFRFEGHAGAGEHGNDLVCAAVSALAETTLIGLGNYVKADLIHEIKPGYLVFTLEKEPTRETDVLLETLLLGLTEIAKLYETNLKIDHYRG